MSLHDSLTDPQKDPYTRFLFNFTLNVYLKEHIDIENTLDFLRNKKLRHNLMNNNYISQNIFRFF